MPGQVVPTSRLRVSFEGRVVPNIEAEQSHLRDELCQHRG